MRNCPSRRQLVWLLNEKLGDGELSDVALHLESCAGCQSLLEALTDSRLSRDRDRPGFKAQALFVRRPRAFARVSSSPGWPAD